MNSRRSNPASGNSRGSRPGQAPKNQIPQFPPPVAMPANRQYPPPPPYLQQSPNAAYPPPYAGPPPLYPQEPPPTVQPRVEPIYGRGRAPPVPDRVPGKLAFPPPVPKVDMTAAPPPALPPAGPRLEAPRPFSLIRDSANPPGSFDIVARGQLPAICFGPVPPDPKL
jgi:hypothetical protein